jgi:hypothetical protein
MNYMKNSLSFPIGELILNSQKINRNLPNFSWKYAQFRKCLSCTETRWGLKTFLINSPGNHVIKCMYKQKTFSWWESRWEEMTPWIYFWLWHWLTFHCDGKPINLPQFPHLRNILKITRRLRKTEIVEPFNMST